MSVSSEAISGQAEPSPYEQLLQTLRKVFENQAVPLEVVQDRAGALWAVTGGTIKARDRKYRGLGVAVCSQAVLPTGDSPRLLYRVDAQVLKRPSQAASYGYFEDGGAFLDPDTGQRGKPLSDQHYIAMQEALVGTGHNDGTVFSKHLTECAAKEVANRL